MTGLPLFTWVLGLFNRGLLERSDELRVRREVLAHQRRQLIHQRIPDVDTARASYGVRFEELLQIITAHSPGRRGETPHAWDSELQEGAGPRSGGPSTTIDALYYPELTRTIIFQLPKAQTEEQLQVLLSQETNLWFGQSIVNEELLVAVQEWRQQAGL